LHRLINRCQELHGQCVTVYLIAQPAVERRRDDSSVIVLPVEASIHGILNCVTDGSKQRCHTQCCGRNRPTRNFASESTIELT